MHLSGELAQRLLEAAPEPVLAVDAGGRIVFASHHVRSLFGYASQDLIGRNIECLLAAHCHAAHREHRRRLLEGPDVAAHTAAERLQLQGRHEEGTEFPIEISSTPVSGPGGHLILSFLRDASAEHALARRLTLARQARHRLREHASHELRQPLQALNLLTAAAARQAADDSALAKLAPVIERQREVLETLTALLKSMLETGPGDARLPPRRAEEPASEERSRRTHPLCATPPGASRSATPPGASRSDATLALRDRRRKRP